MLPWALPKPVGLRSRPPDIPGAGLMAVGVGNLLVRSCLVASGVRPEDLTEELMWRYQVNSGL
jgi:hypothetical protein